MIGIKWKLNHRHLIDFVRREVFPSPAALTVDFHSGFGLKDRFWYPYAKTDKEFPLANDVSRLIDLCNETLPHHIYKIEPQSASYVTNGDLWDYLFDEHYFSDKYHGKVFIPWTLEMGSWTWIKKIRYRCLHHWGCLTPLLIIDLTVL